MTYLFVDDERNPDDVTWQVRGDPVVYGDHDWVVVRSAKEAIDWIMANGLPDHISFDHDLGEADVANTGKHVAEYVVNHVLDSHATRFDMRYSVHSKNPVGAENILRLMDRFRAAMQEDEQDGSV